jgi:polysaccharide export outer membrane protein
METRTMKDAEGLSRRGAALALAAALAGAALSGCGSIGGAGPETAAEVLEVEYRLGTGDQLRIIVFAEADLTGPYVVGSQGSVAFPLVGEVQASGLTMQEFTDTLQQQLARYIRQPIVSVEVTNYRPFFILGEVSRPGTYPYSARLTVQNAVATAGGFSYRANTRRVFIKHANEEVEREYLLTSTTPVLPGDTVRIVERRF